MSWGAEAAKIKESGQVLETGCPDGASMEGIFRWAKSLRGRLLPRGGRGRCPEGCSDRKEEEGQQSGGTE